jgi:glutathione transport system substrate-binding protein
MKGIRILIATMLATVLLFTGCSSKSQQTPDTNNEKGQTQQSQDQSGTRTENQENSGGTVIFGLSVEPSHLEPAVDNGSAARAVVWAMYEGLFAYDEKGLVTKCLCEDYTVSDDGLIYTFKLKDANFHNGDPVTAEDVKYTFERVQDPNLGAFEYKNMQVIDTMTVIDDKTLEIKLKNPLAPFVNYLANKFMVIVSKNWTEAHNGDISQNPMGCGPFEFVEWNRGQDIRIKRFEGYRDSNYPKADEIVFKFYPDGNARVNALNTGVVDIIDYVPYEHLQPLDEKAGIVCDVVSGPFMYLNFNLECEVLSDARVRQAISYALRREDVRDTAFCGGGTIMFGTPFTNDQLGYSDKYANYFEYNPEKAKELLAEAGYPNGIEFTLLTSSTYSFFEQSAIAVQASLKEVGINITLDAPDWSTYNAKLRSGEYDALINGYLANVSDPDWISALYATGANYNTGHFEMPEFDELLLKGRTSTNSEERAEIYQQLQKILIDESPHCYILWRPQAYAYSEKVKGFINMPNGSTYNSYYLLRQSYKVD